FGDFRLRWNLRREANSTVPVTAKIQCEHEGSLDRGPPLKFSADRNTGCPNPESDSSPSRQAKNLVRRRGCSQDLPLLVIKLPRRQFGGELVAILTLNTSAESHCRTKKSSILRESSLRSSRATVLVGKLHDSVPVAYFILRQPTIKSPTIDQNAHIHVQQPREGES
ncbi:MAG: hypothetical protein AAF517_27300, partial [Planctomycetota bacterium]